MKRYIKKKRSCTHRASEPSISGLSFPFQIAFALKSRKKKKKKKMINEEVKEKSEARRADSPVAGLGKKGSSCLSKFWINSSQLKLSTSSPKRRETWERIA